MFHSTNGMTPARDPKQSFVEKHLEAILKVGVTLYWFLQTTGVVPRVLDYVTSAV